VHDLDDIDNLGRAGRGMTADSSVPPKRTDWADEYRLEILLGSPDVRSMVSACAQNAHAGMSGEEFLLQFSNVMSLIPGGRSAFLRGAARGRELGLRRGYKVGKTRSAVFTAPIGHVITAALCSLARNSQAVTGTEQLEDGCILTADIPSDLKTLGGILTIQVGRIPNGTAVEGAVKIPGQLYDWGKSKKVLATLMADVPALLPTL
jgi:hypothetical protein